MSLEDDLKQQIDFLKKQLQSKDQDLSTFKDFFRKAQSQMSSLFGQLDRDIEYLKTLQNLLSPAELPHIPGFLFSTKIIQGQKTGGDYFDIFVQKQKLQFGFLLSSSSSYGVSSLFLSILLQWGAQFKKPETEIEQVFEVLRENVCPELNEKDKLHLFYTHVNRKTFEVSYGLVGDILAFHMTKNKIDSLKSHPVFERDNISQVKVSHFFMSPKDSLLVLSPGVFQTPHHKTGELYPRSRVLDLIQESTSQDPHDLRNRIFFDLQQFSQKDSFDKDLSCVVFHIKDKTLYLA